MRKYIYLLVCLIFAFTASFKNLYAQVTTSAIVILEVPNSLGGEIDAQRSYSVQYLLEVAGLSYTVTSDYAIASKAKVIIATRGFDGSNLSAAQSNDLKNFVQSGGILFLPNLKDRSLFELAGIEDEDFDKNRYLLIPNIDEYPHLFPLFDKNRELSLSIGDSQKSKAANSRAYFPTTAEVLMRFNDDKAALVKNNYGSGTVYSFGFAFRDLVTRNQMNRDLSANRSYSNDFEAVTDMFGFIFREIIASHSKHLVYKHTALGSHKANLILTHDIDSRTGMEWMTAFAAEEHRRGIKASYLITTHYLTGMHGSDYFNPYKHLIKPIYDLGHEVGSHSVAHARDFSDFEHGVLGNSYTNYFPDYNSGKTSGGSVLGELEVSRDLLEELIPTKIRSFRAGHLEFPNTLINGLSELGYEYNTTNSANDVLTSFPYFPVTDRSFNGHFTNVMEIPMTISDVFDDGFTEQNADEKVGLWSRVSQQYFDNNMPVVLLMHPNRDYKLTALTNYLDLLDESIHVGTLAEYGDFWRYRSTLNYQTEVVNNVLFITFKAGVEWNNSLSLIVSEPDALSDIVIKNALGNFLSFKRKTDSDGKLFLIPDNSSITEPPVEEPSGLLVYPLIGQVETAIPTPMQWKTIANAMSYELQIGYSPVFDTLFSMRSLPTNQIVLDDFLQDTTQYFWKVRANFSNNGKSEWSELGSFRTMLRLPEQPTAKIAAATALRNNELRISWQETKRADTYEFQAAKDIDFTEQLVYYTDIKNAFIDINEGLLATDGFWRIRAKNKAGISEWSASYPNNQLITNIDESELPKEVALFQNYPNPFNPTTQISFYLPQSEAVRLELYNIQGQLLGTLASGPFIGGKHSITLNASTYPSGVYLYRLTTVNRSFVKKMTLIK